jgi:hypothetical protein
MKAGKVAEQLGVLRSVQPAVTQLERSVRWTRGIQLGVILAVALCTSVFGQTSNQAEAAVSSVSNQVVGIGVAVSKITDEPLVVRQVLPSTPAEKAGIKVGFQILSVDGTNTADMFLAECVDRLRGTLGTTVNLVVADPALQKTNTLAIKRETIPITAPPSEPPPVILTGKPLPDLASSGLALADYPSGRPLLVVLIDAEQRPSRRALTLLGEQSAAFKQKGIAVVVLQAAAMDDNGFSAWKKEAALPFPVGRFAGDVDKARLAWGAVALPCIILTDKDHRVAAQGLQPEEVAARVDALPKTN